MGKKARETREKYLGWLKAQLPAELPDNATVRLSRTEARFDIWWGGLGERRDLVLVITSDNAIDDWLNPQLTREKSTAKLMDKVRRAIKYLKESPGSREVRISTTDVRV